MKPLFCAVCLLVIIPVCRCARAAPWQPSPGHTQTPLWPGTPPDATPTAGPEESRIVPVSEAAVAGQPWLEVTRVAEPTLTVYSPRGKNTGAAVLVCPGGGYQILAIDLEGTEICDWLNSRGITAVLLKYRVPGSGPYWDDEHNCRVNPKEPRALEDAQRALRLVRFHAAEWHVDPHKIGVMGFSAGGHIAAGTSTRFDEHLYPPVDDADKESCRPDFAVACYPGHLWVHEDEDTTHKGAEKLELHSDIHVTAQTSPTFLLQAENDDIDGVEQSLTYYVALKQAKVPVEMHLYAQGGHAFGLRPTEFPITTNWPSLVETWLRTIGMLPK